MSDAEKSDLIFVPISSLRQKFIDRGVTQDFILISLVIDNLPLDTKLLAQKILSRLEKERQEEEIDTARRKEECSNIRDKFHYFRGDLNAEKYCSKIPAEKFNSESLALFRDYLTNSDTDIENVWYIVFNYYRRYYNKKLGNISEAYIMFKPAMEEAFEILLKQKNVSRAKRAEKFWFWSVRDCGEECQINFASKIQGVFNYFLNKGDVLTAIEIKNTFDREIKSVKNEYNKERGMIELVIADYGPEIEFGEISSQYEQSIKTKLTSALKRECFTANFQNSCKIIEAFKDVVDFTQVIKEGYEQILKFYLNYSDNRHKVYNTMALRMGLEEYIKTDTKISIDFEQIIQKNAQLIKKQIQSLEQENASKSAELRGLFEKEINF